MSDHSVRYCESTSQYLESIKTEALSKASAKARAFYMKRQAAPFVLADAAQFSDDAQSSAEEKWLFMRKKYIGGSDAAAVIGKSRFRTNLDVYYDKTEYTTKQTETDDDKELRFSWGHLAEEYLSLWCQKRWKLNEIIHDRRMFTMNGYPFIGADVDRLMKMVDGRYVILEFKTTTRDKLSAWDNDQIPEDYEIQVRHYMAVLGLWEAIIVCMVDQNKILIRHVTRDLDKEYEIIQDEISFWKNCVEPKKIPNVISNADKYLTSYYANNQVASKKESHDISFAFDDCKKYIIAKQRRDEAKRRFDESEETLKRLSVPIVQALGNCIKGWAIGPNGEVFFASLKTRGNATKPTLTVNYKKNK